MAVRAFFGQKSELSVFQMAFQSQVPQSLESAETLRNLSNHTGL